MNRYVCVTGAAGGIGEATVKLLVEKGFYVLAADLQLDVLKKFSSPKVIPILLDITDLESINSAVRIVSTHTSNLHGIVNIAGVFDQFPLVEAKPESFEKLIRTNLFGPQFITQALFSLLEKGNGRVVNLSSETVLVQMPLQAYGLSKKLMDVWNTQLRMELKLLDMHVSVVRAGGHLTPFIKKTTAIIGNVDANSRYADLMRQIKVKAQSILMKTNNDPSDVARVIYKALTTRNPKNI